MFKSSPQKSIIRWAIFAAIFAILTACGGGGGGGNPPPNVPSPTPQPDTTPDGLSFEAKANVDLSEWVESEPVVIAGINREVAISISGGEYAIGDDDFTDEAGTITVGQAVRVRVMSAATLDTASQATLTVGEGEAIFTATTFADTQAPVAEIAFPPPVSMTANTTLTVRGTVTDDYSEVTEMAVLINGADRRVSVELVADEDNPGVFSWNVTITLNPDAENIVIVKPIDSAGNIGDETASVKVTQGSLDNQFPDAENSIGDIFSAALDIRDGQRNLITVANDVDTETSAITVLDLNTSEVIDEKGIAGLPEEFWFVSSIILDYETNWLYASIMGSSGYGIARLDLETGMANSQLLTFERSTGGYPGTVVIDRDNVEWRALFPLHVNQTVYEMDLGLTEIVEFSGLNTPTSENPLAQPSDALLCNCAGENRIFVLDGEAATILELDPITGAREIFSEEGLEHGITGFLSSNPKRSLALDSERNRLLITGIHSDRMIAVNLSDGARSIVSQHSTLMPFERVTDLVFDPVFGYALIVGNNYAIFAVDLVTGERVVISKSGESL